MSRRTDPRVLVESLARAVAIAEGRMEGEPVTAAAAAAARAEGRLGHGTDRTVVALLGATGSGKSSLFNALLGREVAVTGVRRPTTNHTSAAVWGGDDAGPLLDWLDVSERHAVDDPGRSLDGLVLLDVPDHDSVAVGHRLEMERIAAHTDLLVWVTDPEKYADRVLHCYLRALAGRDTVLLVVLNKSDLLGPDELATCRSDLARLLVADGLPGATMMAVSAATGAGVAELRAQLGRAVAARQAAVERIRLEVRAAAADLATHVGADGQAAGVSDRSRRRLLDDLADAAGVASVEAAVAAGHRRDAAAKVGWPVTRWVGRLRPHPLRRLHLGPGSTGRTSRPGPPTGQRARADAAIRAVAEEAAGAAPEPWPGLLRRAANAHPAELHDRLDLAIADAVRHERRAPRWWTLAASLQWVLAIAAAVGAAWLVALAVVAWLQLPRPPTPTLGVVPAPTLALVLGLGGGWLLALLGRTVARRGARRRAAAVRARVRDRMDAVVDELVIGPIEAELREREALLAALRTARS
jgi:GTP-binding protein EngB required for normal cell division